MFNLETWSLSPEESGTSAAHPWSRRMGNYSGRNTTRDFWRFCRIPVVSRWEQSWTNYFIFFVGMSLATLTDGGMVGSHHMWMHANTYCNSGLIIWNQKKSSNLLIDDCVDGFVNLGKCKGQSASEVPEKSKGIWDTWYRNSGSCINCAIFVQRNWLDHQWRDCNTILGSLSWRSPSCLGHQSSSQIKQHSDWSVWRCL